MCASMTSDSAIAIRRMAARNALKPKYADVKLGFACNNNCLFCTAAWKKELGDRDTQTIFDEVEQLETGTE